MKLLILLSFFSTSLYASRIYINDTLLRSDVSSFEVDANGDIRIVAGGASNGGGGSNSGPVAGASCSGIPSNVILYSEMMKDRRLPAFSLVNPNWGVNESQKTIPFPTGAAKTVAIEFTTGNTPNRGMFSVLPTIPSSTLVQFEMWVSRCPGGPAVSPGPACAPRKGNGINSHFFLAHDKGCVLEKNTRYYLNIHRYEHDIQCRDGSAYCYTKIHLIYAN